MLEYVYFQVNMRRYKATDKVLSRQRPPVSRAGMKLQFKLVAEQLAAERYICIYIEYAIIYMDQ